MALNACTPLKSSHFVVADTSPLLHKGQGKVREFCFSFSVATMHMVSPVGFISVDENWPHNTKGFD